MSEITKPQSGSLTPRVTLKKKPVRRVAITRHNEYVERYIHATARRHMWKMNHYYDLEDLIQDGFLCWYKVCDKYADDVDRSKHLMALFKTTFLNHIHRVAAINKTDRVVYGRGSYNEGMRRSFTRVESRLGDTLSRGQQALHKQNSENFALERIDALRSLSEIDLDMVIAEAPALVQMALRYLVSDEGAERLRKPFRILSDGTKETMNDRLCRIFDLDPSDFNITAEIRNYLYDRLNVLT